MHPITLQNLIARKKETATILNDLLDTVAISIGIRDAEGRLLLGHADANFASKYPVEFAGEILGWVTGGEPAAAVAALITYLASKETEKKTLGSEVLNLYREINLIYNFSEKLAASLDLANVGEIALRESCQLIKATGGVVLIADEQSSKLVTVASFGESIRNTQKIGYGVGIIGGMIATGNAEIINDVQADARAVQYELTSSSMICAPLKIKEQVKGVIVLANTTPVTYTAAELKLLMAIASQAALGLENAQLHIKMVEEATRKIELRRQELEKAVQERTAEIKATLEELKATQQQLIQQEKLASLGQLTAGIAHEIKNPLNFVNNFAELSVELMEELRENLEKLKDQMSESDRENLEDILAGLTNNARKISEHGKRADSIVKSMLEHSRAKSGERQEMDINAMLEQDLNLAFHGMRSQDSSFNVTIEKDFARNLEKINIVPQDISRVFLNIITNGFYAAHKRKMAQGLEAANFTPTVKVSTRSTEKQIEIRIRDNGTGIPEEIRDKIFNPFFTTKPAGQGTGLGLSICHDIVVQAYNGEIRVESNDGEFTEFIVALPR